MDDKYSIFSIRRKDLLYNAIEHIDAFRSGINSDFDENPCVFHDTWRRIIELCKPYFTKSECDFWLREFSRFGILSAVVHLSLNIKQDENIMREIISESRNVYLVKLLKKLIGCDGYDDWYEKYVRNHKTRLGGYKKE